MSTERSSQPSAGAVTVADLQAQLERCSVGSWKREGGGLRPVDNNALDLELHVRPLVVNDRGPTGGNELEKYILDKLKAAIRASGKWFQRKRKRPSCAGSSLADATMEDLRVPDQKAAEAVDMLRRNTDAILGPVPEYLTSDLEADVEEAIKMGTIFVPRLECRKLCWSMGVKSRSALAQLDEGVLRTLRLVVRRIDDVTRLSGSRPSNELGVVLIHFREILAGDFSTPTQDGHPLARVHSDEVEVAGIPKHIVDLAEKDASASRLGYRAYVTYGSTSATEFWDLQARFVLTASTLRPAMGVGFSAHVRGSHQRFLHADVLTAPNRLQIVLDWDIFYPREWNRVMARFWAGDYEVLSRRAPSDAAGDILAVARALRDSAA